MNPQQSHEIAQAVNQCPHQDFGERVSETCGKFTLRYGYDSSMDLLNVIGALEQKGIHALEVAKVLKQMAKAHVPSRKLASYLADYYKLFGY